MMNIKKIWFILPIITEFEEKTYTLTNPNSEDKYEQTFEIRRKVDSSYAYPAEKLFISDSAILC